MTFSSAILGSLEEAEPLTENLIKIPDGFTSDRYKWKQVKLQQELCSIELGITAEHEDERFRCHYQRLSRQRGDKINQLNERISVSG